MGIFTNIFPRIIPAAIVAILLSATSLQAQQTEAALAEMQTMANALEVCALDTDRYVALENLNDISAINNVRPYDSIKDLGGVYTIIPQDGFFLPRKDLTVGPLSWQGPYVSFQSDRTQTDPDPYDVGSPLDPWGNPYYLFNPFGLIRGDLGMITLELYGDSFDRYTIISLGPDGVKSSDDIPYVFGPGVTSTRLTSLHGSGVVQTSAALDPPTYDVEAGTTLTLRGFNFGSPSPDKTVRFGDVMLEDVSSWNNREVQVKVPETLSGVNTFSLQLGSGSTNSITATITNGNTAVQDWASY